MTKILSVLYKKLSRDKITRLEDDYLLGFIIAFYATKPLKALTKALFLLIAISEISKTIIIAQEN